LCNFNLKGLKMLAKLRSHIKKSIRLFSKHHLQPATELWGWDYWARQSPMTIKRQPNLLPMKAIGGSLGNAVARKNNLRCWPFLVSIPHFVCGNRLYFFNKKHYFNYCHFNNPLFTSRIGQEL